MTDKIYSFDEIKAIVKPIAEKYGVERVYLFGSYARGEASADSDIDFLVDRGKLRGLQHCGMRLDLTDAFEKDVDMVSSAVLYKKARFAKSVNFDKKMLYGEAI